MSKNVGTLEVNSPRRALIGQAPRATLDSGNHYSDVDLDNVERIDANNQQEKLVSQHMDIQRKLQNSVLKDYNFDQDIQELIYTKQEKDAGFSAQSYSPSSPANGLDDTAY